jgi:outer membrane protein assembly factor BamB
MSSWGKRQIFRIKIIYIITLLVILLPVCRNKNHRPDTPDTPAGPTIGRIDYAYNFSIEAIDPDEDSVAVRCYWGEGDTSDWSPFDISGKVILLSHSWSDTGTYYLKAQVKDNSGLFSHWSEPCTLRIIIDEPPATPIVPFGPSEGKINLSYDFASSATDPNWDKVSIRFDWGNGDTSDWSLFKSTGDTITTSYTWITPGAYSVRAQAKDVYDMTSDWSEGISVMITNLGTLKWRYHTSDFREIISSPAIGSDGTIYFGSLNDTLYALNPNGSLKWSYSTNGDIYSSPAIGPDGTIYFGSYDNYLYALNPDGSLKWRYDAGTDVYTSPAIGQDGTIYFGQMWGEYYHGYFNALNPDGTLKWQYLTNHDIYTSPAIGPDGTILYFGTSSKDTNNYLYAFNPDGSIKWSYPTFNIISSPAIGSDGSIYFVAPVGFGGSLYALNSDGTLKWMSQDDLYSSTSPAIDSDGTIYCSGNGLFFYAINPDGTLKWRRETWAYGRTNFAPLIGSDGTIYCGLDNGSLEAINPDGTLKWIYHTGQPKIETSPAISQDGTIYYGCNDGYLYAVQGSGQLANTPWPKFRHDSKNTGRFGGP